MNEALRKLALLAVTAAGCGSGSGPAVLHGPLAFPVVVVDVDTYPLSGSGAPDAGWAFDLSIQSACFLTDGEFQDMKIVDLQIWSPDGGPPVTGTWPLIDPIADLGSGSAIVYYRGQPASGPGVGGSITLTATQPAYVCSFVTTINGQSLSGTFSTAGPDQCICTALPNGGMECPE
jgi:hypothetical protein